MNEKELQKHLKELRKYIKAEAGTKKAAKRFLLKLGVITKKGNTTNAYKPLCIQQDII